MYTKILIRIKKLRKKNNLTQKDMAKILGYKSAKGYHDIECGRIKIRLEHLQKLSSNFHIPIKYFFE
jgi:transcriptional regulator with XRE-family HTH domain|nr:MAG TPA: Helix-turn-helix XRE-family like protein [Caudoviricetes sp.]